MTVSYQANYVFKGTSKTKAAAVQTANDFKKVEGAVNKLTVADLRAASATSKLTKAAQVNQSKISAAGGAISGMAFAAGGATGKLGQATQALAGMAGVVAAAGPLVGGITALGIGVSILVGKLDETDQAAKEAARALKETLGATLTDLKEEIRNTVIAIEDIGKTAAQVEQDNIKRRIRTVQTLKAISDQMLSVQEDVDRQTQASQYETVTAINAQKGAFDHLVDLIGEVITGKNDLARATDTILESTSEYNAVLANSNNLTEQETLLNELLTETIKEQGKAKANQISQAKVYAEVIDNTAQKTKELMEAEAKYFQKHAEFSLAAPFVPSTAAIGGGSRGGVRAAPTGGGAAGFDISAISGLAGAAGAPEVLTGAISAGAGAGGMSAAVGSIAAVAGPQIVAAIAAAMVAAAAAPFIATGVIISNIISEGIISNITSLPDKIFEALTQEDPVQFISDFLAESFLNLEKISANLGPVLERVTAFLPSLLESSMVTFFDVLITTLVAAPQIINQLLLGFVKMLAVVMDQLPELLSAMVPALIQGFLLLLPAAIALVLGVGLLVPVALVIVGALIEALLSPSTWAMVGKMFGQMGAMIGSMVGVMWNAMIKPVNELIVLINDTFDAGLKTIPKATISSPSQISSGVPGAGAAGTGGSGGVGGGGGVQGPVMRRTDIPTFHNGGLIGRGGSREVTIRAREDEAVLNPGATSRIGKAGVDALNSGAPMVVRFEGDGSEFFELLAGWLNRQQRNGRRLPNGGVF